MADAAPTYNDGLWTPDPVGEGAAATPWEAAPTDEDGTGEAAVSSSTPAAVVAATTTSVAPAYTTTSEAQWTPSTTAAPARTTTPMASPPPSSRTTTQAAALSSSSSSSRDALSSSRMSSSVPLSSASVAAASADANALASTSSGASFDNKLIIIPLAVGVPILIALIALGCTYRRCWGKRRRDEQSSWLGGGSASMSRRRRDMEVDEGSEEVDALTHVQTRDDDWDDFDEKAAIGPYAPRPAPPQQPEHRGWTGYVPASIRRTLSTASRRMRSPPVPFVSVQRPSIDEQPFLPPTESVDAFQQSFRPLNDAPSSAQRWNWGAQPAPTTAAPVASSLTSGWGWIAATQKYRAKSGSHGSRGSMRSRLGADGPPMSPSVYSPEVNRPYAGLADRDDELEMREEDLNAYLGESRVGNNQLARRFVSGEDVSGNMPPRQPLCNSDATREQYMASSAFSRQPVAGMPAPPSRTLVSPTKASAGSSVLRGAIDTPPRGLLFNYESPPVQRSIAAPPLINPMRADAAAPSSPRPPLPQPPRPRQPLFTASQPDVFSSSPPPKMMSKHPVTQPGRSEDKPAPSPTKAKLPAAQSTAARLVPDFTDTTSIPRLEHPSRVRNAIMNLEERAAKVESPPMSPAPATRPVSSVAAQAQSSGRARRVMGGTTTYSRPMKGGSDDETDGVSSMLLERRKTAEGEARPLSSDPKRLSAMLRRPSGRDARSAGSD